MNKKYIKLQFDNAINNNEDIVELHIDTRAKIVINIKRIINNDYLTTTKYILDSNEIHFATLRELMNRLFVNDINKYFEENIWKSTSAHGKNNKKGITLICLRFELNLTFLAVVFKYLRTHSTRENVQKLKHTQSWALAS